MSLLTSDTNAPLFTLRKHTHPITCLQLIHVPIIPPSPTKIQKSNEILQGGHVFKPYVVSVDESGLLIIWDLSIRRPIMEFKAHSSQIMTIRQLGIDRVNDDFVIDYDYFGMIITHGRDHCIKVWNIFDAEKGFDNNLVYEIPVNALNFSNVDILNNNLLITPNTLNSESFDIYDISFLSKKSLIINENKLKRIFENVDVFKHCQENGHKFTEFKIDNSDDVNRTSKFGIIMKLVWIDEKVVFIGYESGHIVQLKLDFDNVSIEIISINNNHFPDPILSLTYDSINKVVISSSIKSIIVIHEINSSVSNSIKLDIDKISNIGIINDIYIITSWNGLIKFYKLNNHNLECLSNFKKPKGMIQGDLNIIGNLNNDEDVTKKNKLITKPNSITLTQKRNAPSMGKYNRRDLKLITSDLVAVGYDDGTIMLYNEI